MLSTLRLSFIMYEGSGSGAPQNTVAGTISIVRKIGSKYKIFCFNRPFSNRKKHKSKRITARGQLRLCLFSEGGFDLRPLLKSSQQHDELVEFIQDKLLLKKYSHHLEYRITGDNTNFAQMGG